MKRLKVGSTDEYILDLTCLIHRLAAPAFTIKVLSLDVARLWPAVLGVLPSRMPLLRKLELRGNDFSNSRGFALVPWTIAFSLLLQPATALEILVFETDWLDGLHDAITTFHDRQPVKTLKTVRIITSTATTVSAVRAVELAILKRDLGVWSRASQVDVVFEERA